MRGHKFQYASNIKYKLSQDGKGILTSNKQDSTVSIPIGCSLLPPALQLDMT